MRALLFSVSIIVVIFLACAPPSAEGPAPPGPAPASPHDPSAPTFDDVTAQVSAYKAAHPGHGGKDWDINAKSNAELAGDAAALALVSLCGDSQRPVIPQIAWEYGGADHPWIAPEASALVYCVYIPVASSTSHWTFDNNRQRVTADSYVLFPDDNPCRNNSGRDLVAGCIGDDSNFEILVDTASRDDGASAGLSLSEASTELRLLLADGSTVQLVLNR